MRTHLVYEPPTQVLHWLFAGLFLTGFIMALVLAIIAVMVEGSIAAIALFGVFYVFRGSIELKNRLEKEITDFTDFKKEVELWKLESRKYLDELSAFFLEDLLVPPAIENTQTSDSPEWQST